MATQKSKAPFRLWFIAGFVILAYFYLLIFDFSYQVLMGELSRTEPAFNAILYVICCSLAVWIYLIIFDHSPRLAAIYFIASPFIFATLFVELILLFYAATNSRGSINLPTEGGPAMWLIQGPVFVAQLWYIFIPPAIAGIVVRTLIHRRQERRLARWRAMQGQDGNTARHRR